MFLINLRTYPQFPFAHKVVVRGNIIQYSSRLKKVRQERQKELEVAFCKASDDFKADPSQDLAKARLELDMLLGNWLISNSDKLGTSST